MTTTTRALGDALHERAIETTGFDDFGDDGYQEGLFRLIDELVATMGDDAETVAARLASAPLAGRLRSQEQWRRHPDVLRRELPGPLVITGLPRTGTTALHRLLAFDDRFQVLQHWIQHHPMPRPERARWEHEAAYQEAVSVYEAMPEVLRVTHLVEPTEAEECLALMAQSFTSNLFGSGVILPEYDEWFLGQTMEPSFRRYADNLRLVGAHDDRPWLLKNPSHVLALDELFAVFPDAVVVQTHRKPLDAIGSVVSLLSELYQGDPHPRAARELRVWGEGAARADAQRDVRPEQFVDVDYRELVADPFAAVVAVYRQLGLEISPALADCVRAGIAANPQHKHGQHSYDPAALGVTEDAIEEHFGAYIARHHLG